MVLTLNVFSEDNSELVHVIAEANCNYSHERQKRERDSKTTNSRLTEEQKLLLQKERKEQMLENSFSQLDYIFLLQY